MVNSVLVLRHIFPVSNHKAFHRDHRRSFSCVGSHVNRKVGLTSIPSRTLIADQPWLAVVVKFQVIFQMLLGCEIFSTLRTVGWTVSCVLVHVNSQMGFLNKSFVTNGTLMQSMVCVQHHVFGKNSSCNKTFSTLGTHMTLGPVTGTCMNSGKCVV